MEVCRVTGQLTAERLRPPCPVIQCSVTRQAHNQSHPIYYIRTVRTYLHSHLDNARAAFAESMERVGITVVGDEQQTRPAALVNIRHVCIQEASVVESECDGRSRNAMANV